MYKCLPQCPIEEDTQACTDEYEFHGSWMDRRLRQSDPLPFDSTHSHEIIILQRENLFNTDTVFSSSQMNMKHAFIYYILGIVIMIYNN